MPSTLAGLAIFVISLAPGLTYVMTRQRVAPQQTMTAIRETAQLICVSLFLDIAILILFAGVRALWPSGTPDIDRLVREPAVYLRESYSLVWIWSVALLAVAVVTAALIGSGLMRGILSRLPGVGVRPAVTPHESGVSAWWLLFQEKPGRRIHVGCNLDDGSYVSGWLAAFSTTVDDTGDRDLTLAAPLRYRPKGVAVTEELANTSAVVVSARKITLLHVSYQTGQR
jgi:hypothetical protein